MIKLNDGLLGVTHLGLDTAPFIYFVERNPLYVDLMRQIIRRIDIGDFEACSSTVTLTEVLTQPLRLSNQTLADEYRDLLYKSRNFNLFEISTSIAETAAQLRADYRLRTPDALQVATALEAGCEAFLCNDKDLQRVTEIKVLALDDLEL